MCSDLIIKQTLTTLSQKKTQIGFLASIITILGVTDPKTLWPEDRPEKLLMKTETGPKCFSRE
jgi:hypothetical protein